VKAKLPTQDELLQCALDMEDGNIAAHRNYLANEEEKRRRAHVVRVAVQGPLIRWISRRDVIAPPLSESPLGSGSAPAPACVPTPVSTSPLAGTLSDTCECDIHQTSSALI
jgi:hypothetical protein